MVVVFAGVMSSIASDAGYVVLVPLGAVIFMSCGRHPLAGIAAAFAGVSGGFSANLFPGPVDALLAGMTTEGAHMFDPSYSASPVGNWYFIMASTVVITLIGTLVTEKIVEPRLGKYRGELIAGDEDAMKPLDEKEKRGLKFAGLFALVGIILIGALVVPANGILRNPETGEILSSPFMNSIVVSIAFVFLLAGVGYGIGEGKIKSDKDIIGEMGKTMSTMGSYIVLVFFAAQFVAYFGKTNLGTVIAVKGS